jgi:tetratricopeptide (TPR) repeat protein
VITGADRPNVKAQAEKDADDQATQIEWFTLPDDPQRLYALAAILFLFALLSKTITCSMPAAALLIIWWKRGRLVGRDFLPVLPLLVVGAAMGMLTGYMERVRVGVEQRQEDWDFAPTLIGEFFARTIIAGKAIWFYVGKLVFPQSLSFSYSPRWTIDHSDLPAYLYPLSVLAIVVTLVLLRKRIGLGPLVAVLFFIGTLFPALGFVNVWPMRFSFVADHFVYLSAIGLIALGAAIAAKYLPLEAMGVGALVVLLLLFTVSFAHEQIFKDEKTLWEATWEKSNHKSWLAASNYGGLLMRLGYLNAAEAWFEHVIKLKPDHPEARMNLAKISIARAQDAQEFRAQVLQRPTTLPTTVPTTQEIDDYFDRAIAYYREAVELQPDFVDARFELGQLLVTLNRYEQAKEQLRTVLELYPRHELAHLELGTIALQEQDSQAAIRHFLRAAEINPESPYAHARLGTALLQAGQVQQGFIQWEEAMRLAPNNPRWPTEFGARMADAGQYGVAIDFTRRALEIDPRHVEALTNFGVIAAKTGFPDRAEALFKQALEIEPGFDKALRNLDALKSGRLRPATTRASTLPATVQESTR